MCVCMSVCMCVYVYMNVLCKHVYMYLLFEGIINNICTCQYIVKPAIMMHAAACVYTCACNMHQTWDSRTYCFRLVSSWDWKLTNGNPHASWSKPLNEHFSYLPWFSAYVFMNALNKNILLYTYAQMCAQNHHISTKNTPVDTVISTTPQASGLSGHILVEEWRWVGDADHQPYSCSLAVGLFPIIFPYSWPGGKPFTAVPNIGDWFTIRNSSFDLRPWFQTTPYCLLFRGSCWLLTINNLTS